MPLNDNAKPTGFYRSATDLDLYIAFDDGSRELLSSMGKEFFNTLASLNEYKKNMGTITGDSTDWYLSLEDAAEAGAFDGNAEGVADDGDGNPEGQEADQGDGESEGQEADQGDGESDDSNDGQDESDTEAEGEGEADSEDEADEQEDELDFEQRQGKDGEDDPIEGNPLADELWKVFKPRVREIAHNYAEYAANYAMRHGGTGGNGGLSDKLLQFDAGVIKTPEGTHHAMFPKVLAAVQRGVNVYLPGPPGTGKSHMVKQIAEALEIPFGVTSFSPMSTESKLLGFRDAKGDTVRTVFRDRYEFGGGMLLDELDNANGAVIAVTNGGLANGFMEFPDGVVERHPDFICIATANTLGTGPTAEFAGRQKLDPATLNRFVKMFIDTDERMEDHIVHGMIGEDEGTSWLRKVRHVRRACNDLHIKAFVTMRDSINGARLIAPGPNKFSHLEALECTIMAVIPADAQEKIKAWRG